MAEKISHDLFDFMKQISSDIAAEYARIQKRVIEDPGTAGDQGEENWAKILRQWLPPIFKIVTKGRIINEKGETSPQIDILVLSESYPEGLLDKKLYLAAGVIAAFECKITLRAGLISEAIENCAKVKALYTPRTGSPYKELHAPIIYGLLAHSHMWTAAGAKPVENVNRNLYLSDQKFADHPRKSIDLLCVADLGTWTTIKSTFIGPCFFENWDSMAHIYGPNGSATSAFIARHSDFEHQDQGFTPLGAFIADLTRKIAWEKVELRAIADYYRLTGMPAAGAGDMRCWPTTIYSDEIRGRIESGQLTNGKVWDEWGMAFF